MVSRRRVARACGPADPAFLDPHDQRPDTTDINHQAFRGVRTPARRSGFSLYGEAPRGPMEGGRRAPRRERLVTPSRYARLSILIRRRRHPPWWRSTAGAAVTICRSAPRSPSAACPSTSSTIATALGPRALPDESSLPPPTPCRSLHITLAASAVEAVDCRQPLHPWVPRQAALPPPRTGLPASSRL